MRIVLLLAFVVACKGSNQEHPLAAAAKANDSEVSPAVPIFHVANLRASQAYYRDSLGFKVEWDYGDPPDFGAVRRGDGVLFQCQGCGMAGAWVMMFVKDVDKLHDEIAANGAIIKMPPTNMPWGVREMHVADRDGNLIRFGGPEKK